MAAEDNSQTLKTVLTRSTSRLKLITAKMGALATYVVVLLVVFGVSATAIGAFAAGANPVSLGRPVGGDPLRRSRRSRWGSCSSASSVALAAYTAPLMAVSAWGFLLSTVTRNSGASIVGMLVFSFANQIIRFLPNVPESVGQWLLTDQFTAWQAALGTSIDWSEIARATGVSALYLVLPLLFSAWWFARRDVLV